MFFLNLGVFVTIIGIGIIYGLSTGAKYMVLFSVPIVSILLFTELLSDYYTNNASARKNTEQAGFSNNRTIDLWFGAISVLLLCTQTLAGALFLIYYIIVQPDLLRTAYSFGTFVITSGTLLIFLPQKKTTRVQLSAFYPYICALPALALDRISKTSLHIQFEPVLGFDFPNLVLFHFEALYLFVAPFLIYKWRAYAAEIRAAARVEAG